jgi:hypothetical protein
VRLGALLVSPYLLLGLRRLADSARGTEARRSLRRAFVVVLLLVPLVAVGDFQLPNVVGGGSSLTVLGLLAFSSGMWAWSRHNAAEVLPAWSRARALTLLVSVAVVAGWAVLIARRASEGRWWSPDLSGHGALPTVVAAGGALGGVLAVASVWWATRTTMAHLDRRRGVRPA